MKNPPAFPLQHQPALLTNEGMTLRDYFAAKAMTRLIGTALNVTREDVAVESYRQADAMLKAREQ